MGTEISADRIALERLGSLLNAVTEGFQLISHDYRYLYVNDAVCRHGRLERSQLIGRAMGEVYPGIEQTEMFGKLRTCMTERRAVELENEFTYPDGKRGWFELRMEPVPEGAFILSVDITARKTLEAQLLHSQKMDAVGRLAGGVAHDFNNLLSVILAYAQLLGSSLDKGDRRKEDVAEIEQAASRAGKLTRELLAFSRQQVVEQRVLDVGDVVRGTQNMMSRLVGEDVDLEWHLGGALRKVFADPGRLEQVLVNLIVNARDAMPQGGRITIETADVELDRAYADDHPGIEPGDFVMLAVTDTGCGMDRETQSKIFDPFFTTKPSGRGTGLGLATAYGIVRQVGGDIWVYSEPGQGTTFKVYLPAVSEAGVPEPVAAPPRREIRGDETILLVEDDAQVRAAATRILCGLGYELIVAQHPDEALGLVSASGPHAIHLLLSDVVMPGMSGVELARRIAVDRPEIKVLCFSGYTEEVVTNHGLLTSGIPFLQKPFTAESLGRRVREVLEGGLAAVMLPGLPVAREATAQPGGVVGGDGAAGGATSVSR